MFFSSSTAHISITQYELTTLNEGKCTDCQGDTQFNTISTLHKMVSGILTADQANYNNCSNSVINSLASLNREMQRLSLFYSN